MRTSIALVVLVLAVSALAAACGGGAPEPTRTPTPTPTLVREPTSTPTPTEAAPTSTPTTTAADPVALGRSLAARNGCAACHSVDGSASIGPTWKGLYGKEETLVDGSKVTVDDAYLHESTVDPNAKIVKGFASGIMPNVFGEVLSEGDIKAIIEYIKTLN